MKNNRKGFTLIEMLIVIAIIGILASIVLIGIGPVQRQARDSRRAADLRQVQNALELCFSKVGAYPNQTAWVGGAASLSSDLTGGTAGCGAGGVVRQVPDDPRGGTNHYSYGTDAARTGYVLGAVLEDASNPLLQQDIDTNPVNGVNCSDGAGNNMYCVQF